MVRLTTTVAVSAAWLWCAYVSDAGISVDNERIVGRTYVDSRATTGAGYSCVGHHSR